MQIHLDLTEDQIKALEVVAIKRGLPIESLIQGAVQLLINEETLSTLPSREMINFARTLNLENVDANSLQYVIVEKGFTFPKPSELMALPEDDRSVLLQLSALLAEDAYRNDPDLNFEVYDDIIDYDDIIIDTNAKHL